MPRFPAHRLPLTAYDPMLVKLAREVGAMLCRYGDGDALALVEWLVDAGATMQGKPAGWIASAYRAGNLL